MCLCAGWAVGRRGSPGVFLAASILGFAVPLGVIFAFVCYVNPWGDYGSSGFHWLYNARLMKTDYIDALPADRRPRAWVMGSSNTMSYKPSTVRRLTGLTAFNYGVFWARADDLLCISAHLIDDLHCRADLLIVGVDTWTVAPADDAHPVYPGLRRRLLNTPQLIRHHPGVSRTGRVWSQVVDAFSQQQIALAWKVWRDPKYVRCRGVTLADSSRFAIDGSRTWYGGLLSDGGSIFEAVESGRFDTTARISRLIHAGRGNELGLTTYDFDRFDDHRVGYLRRMLDKCRGAGVGVVFVINPVHPLFYDLLARRTPHLANLRRLRALLDDFAGQYGNVRGVVDASRIELFGGDPDGFFDAMHPASRNCDLILRAVADKVARR